MLGPNQSNNYKIPGVHSINEILNYIVGGMFTCQLFSTLRPSLEILSVNVLNDDVLQHALVPHHFILLQRL